jgi:hypothetical protein
VSTIWNPSFCLGYISVSKSMKTPLRVHQIALLSEKVWATELHRADLQDALRCPLAGTGCNSQLKSLSLTNKSKKD